MKKARSYMAVLSFVFIFIPAFSFAQQTNFQFSPPPIPWFEFEEGQKDLKVGGTLLYLTGEVKDSDPNPPDLGGDISVYGGGVSAFYRYALRDKFAVDIGGSAVGASGDIGKAMTMKLGIFSVPFDLEFQPVKTDKIAVILFGGFNFTWMSLGVDYDDGTDTGELDMSTTMHGPQFGAQVAFKFPEFVVTPFFMLTRFSGNADIDLSDGTDTLSLSVSIPASTAYFYGVDLVYLPWDLTLSSLIQQVSSSGDNNGFRTYVVTVSHRFQFDKPAEVAKVEPPKKVKPKPIRR